MAKYKFIDLFAGKFKYGSLYNEHGETFIKLNFQIRFK